MSKATDWAVGPEVKFEIEEYDFSRLVRELTEFEVSGGRSTLSIFASYLDRSLDLDDRFLRSWLDLFIMYLGTDEVRRFSCP